MGMETAHPEALDRLNKRFTLEDFATAARALGDRGVALRVFLLISPPFVPSEQQDAWLLRSLERSFAQAPVGRLAVGERLVPTALSMFGEMFRSGIVFAAPVLVFLLIISMVIGILSRAVPAINVLDVGFGLRVLVALIALFLFAPLMEPAMRALNQDLLRWFERGVAAL